MEEETKSDNWLGEMLAKALIVKGIPKQKHIAHIGRVLELTTAAAHKKLTGSTKWEVSQLVKVVHSIGMEMSEFFELYSPSHSETHEALWSEGNTTLKCKIYLSPETSDEKTEYSAVKINDEWCVIHTDDIRDEYLVESKRNIESIVIHPRKIEIGKSSIAILDDDKNIVDSIKEIINDGRFIVDGFYSIDDLSRAIDKSAYDAYILDWVVGDKTVFDTIKKIRQSQKRNSMILVLTEQLEGIIDEEISISINDYDIVGPFEKPIKGSLIKSNIDKFFPK